MDYLKVFTDFARAIEPLSDAEKGRLFVAMLEYAERGAEPDFRGNERFIWPTAKLQIDREAAFLLKQRENGGKGGRPKNPTKPTETQQNPTKPTETQKSHKDKDKDKDKDNISPRKLGDIAHARHKYGQYDNVLLSDDELDKLKAEFPDWQDRIERLSEYIASTGKSYKSHLATIRAWARKDAELPTPVSKGPMCSKDNSWMLKYLKGAER